MCYLFILVSFTVSLSSSLVSGQYVNLDESVQNELESFTSISWIILFSMMGVFLATAFIAFCYHRRLIGCDAPEWVSLLLYFICTVDYMTDLLFFGELSIQQHTLTTWAAMFLFGSHFLSTLICIMYVLRWKVCPPREHNNANANKREWITSPSHVASLLCLTLFGNLYGSIEVSNCKLFHLNMFNMQTSARTRSQCHVLHIIFEVVIGSFPLMIIEMAYMSLNEYTHISIAATAMIFSFISIAIGIFIIVSKLCNNLVEILIPTPYMDQNDAHKLNTQAMHRAFIFKSNDLDSHHVFAHKCIANALSVVLQISDYQVSAPFIRRIPPSAIECFIEITPEMNDRENLSLFLNLLEAPSSGLYDVLKQQIAHALAINESTLEIDVQRVNINGANDDRMVQMGGGGGGGGGPVEWTCAQCTFINHFVIDQCEVCGNPRYSGGIHGGGDTGADAFAAGQTNAVKAANDDDYNNNNEMDNMVMMKEEAALENDIKLAKAQSLEELERNKNANDIDAAPAPHPYSQYVDQNDAAPQPQPQPPPPLQPVAAAAQPPQVAVAMAPNAQVASALDDNDFLQFIADGDEEMEPKELLKMIADDNQNIDAKDGGGLWTGDLVDDDEDAGIDNIPNVEQFIIPPPYMDDNDDNNNNNNNNDDNMMMDIFQPKEREKEIESGIAINESIDMDVANVNANVNANAIANAHHEVNSSFIENDAANNSHNVVIDHRRSTTTQSRRSRHSNQLSTGFEISEINEIEHDIIAPVFDNENSENSEKEKEKKEEEIFNDGLNDDFDDLRQPDAFFGSI